MFVLTWACLCVLVCVRVYVREHVSLSTCLQVAHIVAWCVVCVVCDVVHNVCIWCLFVLNVVVGCVGVQHTPLNTNITTQHTSSCFHNHNNEDNHRYHQLTTTLHNKTEHTQPTVNSDTHTIHKHMTTHTWNTRHLLHATHQLFYSCRAYSLANCFFRFIFVIAELILGQAISKD